jgi:hypothetical protein
MKEEWLFPGALVPVDVETTAALVAEIHRLIGVVGGMALAQPAQPEPTATYTCGVCGVPMQMEQPTQRPWVGLTDEERAEIQRMKWWDWEDTFDLDGFTHSIEARLKAKNT